ncbi:MAG: DUF3365 domain-containing protein [Deltaproteobacteria bacterium]|jgi:hypothetical protein|nr:DUF3365 domain-containing protein [Deltaproteobacteria bacterium]
MKIILAIALIFVTATLAFAGGSALELRKEEVAGAAVEITRLRSERAREVIGTGVSVTPAVFKEVCGSVKKRAMAIAHEKSFKIRHAAVKNRNPKNAATAEELSIINSFTDKDAQKSNDGIQTIEGQDYYRYSAPIYVEKACLSCHGAKENRPAFIVKKYPDDRAYGFKEGDLRGIISVLFPLDVEGL